MEIRGLKADELDYAVLPCVDPGFRKTLKQGMNLRREFLKKMKKDGLSVLVAFDDLGDKKTTDYPGVGRVKSKDLSLKGKIPAGLIEYVPIEKSIFPVKGKNIAFIHCIWVIPPYQRKNVGKALMENFITVTSHLSGAAVVAYEGESWWGYFDYMPTWFFSKFGFKEVQRDGHSVLMFKNYGNAKPPELITPRFSSTTCSKKTKVEFFWSSQCPYSWWVKKLIEKEIGKTSAFDLSFVNTDDRKTVEKSTVVFGLKLNGKFIYNRMPSWDQVKRTLKSVSSG